MNKSAQLLTSKNEDHKLHTSRRMFVIIGSEIKLGPVGTPMSHLEWFESEGWCTAGKHEDFMTKYVRGMHLPGENDLYFYEGCGFLFTVRTHLVVYAFLAKLAAMLELSAACSINLGPKDAEIHGTVWQRRQLGTLGEFTFASSDYQLASAVGRTSLDRWSDCIEHHPLAEQLVRFIAENDFYDHNDHFCWKVGGDGDNGESLAYAIDPFFETLDAAGEISEFVFEQGGTELYGDVGKTAVAKRSSQQLTARLLAFLDETSRNDYDDHFSSKLAGRSRELLIIEFDTYFTAVKLAYGG